MAVESLESWYRRPSRWWWLSSSPPNCGWRKQCSLESVHAATLPLCDSVGRELEVDHRCLAVVHYARCVSYQFTTSFFFYIVCTNLFVLSLHSSSISSYSWPKSASSPLWHLPPPSCLPKTPVLPPSSTSNTESTTKNFGIRLPRRMSTTSGILAHPALERTSTPLRRSRETLLMLPESSPER